MATLEEKTTIAVDGDTISGTFVTPGTLVPGVLLVHGWGGSQAQYLLRAREIASLGCICLTFDLRGHAQTRERYFETVTREQNMQDVLAAYNLLAHRPHVDPNAIAVVGSSYGGYLAAILTSMRRVKWLGLRAPALYIDDDWDSPKLQLHKDHDLKGYRRSFVPAEANRALRAVQQFEGDVLLVESEHDDIIPATVLRSYKEASKHARSLTYRCIAGADHGLTKQTDQKAYQSLLVNWLSEMLFGARGPQGPQAAPTELEAPRTATPETPPRAVA